MIFPKVPFGFTVALNEEECIEGWVRQAMDLCEKVAVYVDPTTTDKTVEILQRLQLEDIYQNRLMIGVQDRSLGNDDKYHPGNAHIFHVNQTMIIRKHVKEGTFFYYTDVDERIDPFQYNLLANALTEAQEKGARAVLSGAKYEFYPDEEHIVNWGFPVNQYIFLFNDGKVERDPSAHGTFNPPTYCWISKVPIYHYSRVKKSQKPFKWWDELSSSDYVKMRQKIGRIDTIPFHNHIANWRTMT
jgi:hypothetical protein